MVVKAKTVPQFMNRNLKHAFFEPSIRGMIPGELLDAKNGSRKTKIRHTKEKLCLLSGTIFDPVTPKFNLSPRSCLASKSFSNKME